MKVGSLVVCVDDRPHHFEEAGRLTKGKIYTVRFISDEDGLIGIGLEEIINPSIEAGELAYLIERFRELETPLSISIEEILHETVPA